MIHQYKNNGYNIVLDVYSGAVHVVDDLCYDVIAVLNEPDEEPTAEILKSDLTWENLKKRLGDTYSEEDLRDALDDVIELTEDGKLFTKDEFEAVVKKTQHYIKEGDIFQCVVSNRREAEFDGSLLNAYRVLRTLNPSPYMFYLSGGDVELTGASPETLVKLTDEERDLLYRLYYQGVSERVLAKQLGISQAAVHKRKEKILKQLRIWMKL